MKTLLLFVFIALLSGCAISSQNTVFPKVVWYWSREAKEQRKADAERKSDSEKVKNLDYGKVH